MYTNKNKKTENLIYNAQRQWNQVDLADEPS